MRCSKKTFIQHSRNTSNFNNVPIHTKVEVWNSFDHDSYWCINFSLKHELNEKERTSEKGLWIKNIIDRYLFFKYQWTQYLRSKDLRVLTIITGTFRRISHAEAIFKRKYWNYVRVFSELYLVQKTVLKIIFSLVALPNHSTMTLWLKKSFLFKINDCLILDNRLISILACHAEFI